MTLRVGSAFAGIEGFGLGLERAGGFEIAWSCEIDTDAQSVLRRWWPEVPLYDDVRTIHGKKTCPAGGCERCVADVDVLCGGSPCQDWSVAGRRAGLAGSRSGLFFDFASLADSLTPRWLLFENVPGLLSACSCPGCARRRSAEEDEDDETSTGVLPGHRGRDFAIVLDELTGFHPGVPYGGWRSGGVCVGPKRTAVWRVLDARHFGVPQRRRRLVLCAAHGDSGAARSRCIEVLLEPDCLSGDSAPGAQAGQESAAGAGGCAGVDGISDVVGTGAVPDADRMSFTETTGTLRSNYGSGGADDTKAQAGLYVPDVAPAVTSKWAKGTGGPAGDETQNLVAELGESLALSVRGRSGGAQLEIEPDDIAPPLRTGSGGSSRPMIFQQNSRSEVRLIGGDGQIAGAVAAEPGVQQQNYLAAESRVRRLTPLECERLQGFPDDHTAGLSDSARYRLLGNAFPVPVVKWVGRRLRFADEKLEMVGVSS